MLELYAALAETITDNICDGKLPNCPDEIATSLISAVPALRDASDKDKLLFFDELVLALRAKLEFQNSRYPV